jgi:hypothetical protein
MADVIHSIMTALRKSIAQSIGLTSRFIAARARTRRDKTRFEAEFFGGRYHFSSKNDDDLPIVS